MCYNNSRHSSEEWSVSCERDCQDVSEADGGGQGDDHDHQWDCQDSVDHGLSSQGGGGDGSCRVWGSGYCVGRESNLCLACVKTAFSPFSISYLSDFLSQDGSTSLIVEIKFTSGFVLMRRNIGFQPCFWSKGFVRDTSQGRRKVGGIEISSLWGCVRAGSLNTKRLFPVVGMHCKVLQVEMHCKVLQLEMHYKVLQLEMH